MKTTIDYTKSEIELARKLWDASDDEGAIIPANLPEDSDLRTTMNLKDSHIDIKDAFSRITGKAWDDIFFMLFSISNENR